MNFKDEAFDIIIQGGQSNAQGRGRGDVTEEYAPSEDILYLYQPYSVEGHIELPNGISSKIIKYEGEPTIEIADERVENGEKIGDFSLFFAKKYKERGLLQKGRKILIIRSAIGSTGFVKGHWKTSDPLYKKMIELIDFAISLNPENKIRCFLWHQGESDSFEGNDPELYEELLKTMYFSVKERYSLVSLPFITGDFVNEWKSQTIHRSGPIADKIKGFTLSVGGVFVETADLESKSQATEHNNEQIHFSREALHLLGERYFDAYIDITKNN